jgi:hypothetical protein
MAKMSAISRLHAEPKGPAERTEEIAIGATHEQVPSPALLPTTERLRGFRRPSEPQAEYSLHRDDVLTLMQPAGPPVDRGSDLQEMALRERLTQAVRLQFARRIGGSQGYCSFRS